jgi:nucleoside-diphosphate-sugar epimerase
VIAGDGKDKIDFTYIEDLIQGIELCISNHKSLGEIFNLTFGEAQEINSLATIVQNEFPGILIKHSARNPLVPERGTLDISKAKEVLGYKPSHDIEIGFKKYISWYLEMGKNFDLNSINLDEAQKNE